MMRLHRSWRYEQELSTDISCSPGRRVTASVRRHCGSRPRVHRCAHCNSGRAGLQPSDRPRHDGEHFHLRQCCGHHEQFERVQFVGKQRHQWIALLERESRWREQLVMNASEVWNDWSCRVRVTVQRPAALSAAKRQLVEIMDDVARAANRFDPHSDISRVNAAAGRMIPVGSRTIGLLDAALDAAAETGGAVDPTIGRHLLQAGYDEDIEIVRGRGEATQHSNLPLPRADWTSVRIDHAFGLVGVPEGVALDLGATAKAMTADIAAMSISSNLGTPVLVEIGGDVSVCGKTPAGWLIAVAEKSGGPGQTVTLTRGGLATSSTIARRWRAGDADQHHIIDPRTGSPATGPWRTVSVWADTAVQANTASTAALVLGPGAEHYLREMSFAARLVAVDGNIRTIGNWPTEAAVAS